MPQYFALGIAAVFALVALLPVSGRHTAQPVVWICLVAGVLGGYVAREAVALVADVLAPVPALVAGPAGAITALLVAAVVGEILKALVPLVIASSLNRDADAGLACGAAAGAGFGFVVVQQGLAMALGLVGSPFITPLSTFVAILGWFFRILQQVVTAAWVGRAGARGGVGLALLLAVVFQAALTAADRLPLVAGVPVGLVVVAVASASVFIYLLGTRAPRVSPAGT